MNTPVVTDVFKFLAVRPAQLVTEKETARTIIRDNRAVTAAGKRELTALAGQLSTPGDALAHWRELDLSSIEPLAEGYRELTRSYERLGPGENPPEAKTLMKDARLSNVKDGSDPNLIGAAWKALYIAHATGRDAGPRLETPMAALRVLHFAQTLAGEPRPSPLAALEALRATVAIPTAFDDAFQPTSLPLAPTTSAPIATSNASTPLGASRRSAQIRSLVTDLHATDRLLESVTTARALENSAARQVSLGPAPGWSARINLTTIPSLSDALPTQLSRDESAILDQLRIEQTASVPFAAETLQSHMQKLTDQASALVDDPEFQTALRELTEAMPLRIAPILPPFVITPPGAPEIASDMDVDVSGRITPVGIGDLKVVKQTLLAYVAGEVAHIENVLKGESKERTHRKLDRTETTIFTSVEETKDTERDTQSTDRFELKREAEQTLKEDMSVKAGLTVTASYGPVVATATGDFAYSTSKQESQKNSSNFAREVVDRSVTKVQTKTKTERTAKTLNEVEEINKHVLDNGQPSTGNITGIYRWVDKRYRAQVYNYGVRLLLEFIIPEPAAFYRATHASAAPKVNAKPPPPFVKDPNIMVAPGAIALGRVGTPVPLTAEHITEFNYLRYAAKYGTVGVLPPPPLLAYTGTSLTKEDLESGKVIGMSTEKFVIPEGYNLNYYTAAFTILAIFGAPKFTFQIGKDSYPILNKRDPNELASITDGVRGDPNQITLASGSVAVSVGAYDVKAFTVNVQGICQRTDEHYDKWKLQVFEKIYTAYQALQTAYDQKVTQAESAAGITIEGQNPAINRIVEKTELKKLCITMMTGQHFKQFGAMTEPPDDAAHPPEVDVYKALDDGPIIHFFEQAFEWEQITYVYYPYFWGRKKNWVKTSNLSDPDPLFQQFLTAGAARVLVPVPLAYANNVIYLLQNGKKDLHKRVWGGGETPTIDSPLYRSIADEFRNRTDDLAGAEPDPDVEPWEFTLPTTLVWLQPDDKLPVFVV